MPSARRIVFRLEAGGTTGWGHLARCAALAGEMRRRGWACSLWSEHAPDAAPDDLRAPFAEARIAGPAWPEEPPPAEWIVVDWYDATDAMLRRLRKTAPAANLLVIDDEAKRTLADAHVIVNPRLGLEGFPYASTARALLGERYALLRAGLREPARVTSPFPPGVAPVLIMLGGTDPRELTAEVIHGLADLDAAAFAPVILRQRGRDAGVHLALARFGTHEWLERLDARTLAGWARVCHYAISACGGTLYELALLGLPFVGVVAADNQHPLATAVEDRWNLPVIDGAGNVRRSVASAVPRLLDAHPWPREQPARPIGNVDGLGSARIADVIENRAG